MEHPVRLGEGGGGVVEGVGRLYSQRSEGYVSHN